MKHAVHICGIAKQPCKPSAHLCAVDLQPCSVPRIYARSIFSDVIRSAYMRAHFAALRQQIASMRGEIAQNRQQNSAQQ